jgi:signal recognition particle subunit SRP54
MFESLSDKLKRTLKNLRGEGVLTKEHVDAALREIRLALLEADVNYKVAKDFISSVQQKAEGQQVWQELKPSEQVVKIVFDELVELLGGQSSRLVFTKQIPNTVMVVGLQGSGKTTFYQKRFAQTHAHVSLDVQKTRFFALVRLPLSSWPNQS